MNAGESCDGLELMSECILFYNGLERNYVKIQIIYDRR